jgi:hypothetical protein
MHAECVRNIYILLVIGMAAVEVRKKTRLLLPPPFHEATRRTSHWYTATTTIHAAITYSRSPALV